VLATTFGPATVVRFNINSDHFTGHNTDSPVSLVFLYKYKRRGSSELDALHLPPSTSKRAKQTSTSTLSRHKIDRFWMIVSSHSVHGATTFNLIIH